MTRATRWRLGLIPAHAGKTREHSCRLRTRRAHPRSRGENLPSRRNPATQNRLIPAHAGKTAGYSARLCASWAHPRSRGENSWTSGGERPNAGSSPLTRGKRPRASSPSAPVRLIPAHAGKTSSPAGANCAAKAHPRSRGENRCSKHSRDPVKGSSPLTRGKLVTCRAARRCRGLIPAHAGKTLEMLLCVGLTRAHPRSRGENEYVTWLRAAQAGSSPLTRGKRQDADRLPRPPGLIPAHAGKTTGACAGASSTTAHPRSRGENLVRRYVP